MYFCPSLFSLIQPLSLDRHVAAIVRMRRFIFPVVFEQRAIACFFGSICHRYFLSIIVCVSEH
jgi:hypothetical protein